MKDTIKTKGKVHFKIFKRFDKWYQRLVLKLLQQFKNNWANLFLNKYGIIKDAWSVDNLITSAGKAAIAGLVGNTGAITAFTYLAVGTSNTAPAIGQTALVGELSTLGFARAAATVSRQTTTVTNDTLQLLYTWTASGTATIEEVGIFNAASVGVMLGRALTTSKSLISGDTLQITYQVIFA